MRNLKFFLPVAIIFGCSQPPTDPASLTEDQKRSFEYSLASMEVADGLEASLYAHEPMLVNPTNIDIDHRGRIWVCEGHNYRLPLNPDKQGNPAGDRILILEDTDADGIADKQTVFYQGNDVNAALGISVLGDKIIVSKSPSILVFTDADGDDKPESKEVLFTGMGGIEHDHGIHAAIFGPDGKLYFNGGNSTGQLLYADSTAVVDMAGNKVDDSGNPYRHGMAFRCNLDGSGLETIGWNFRNPYELSIDSYGNIWQSDNDDDGNQGTRLNFVMEFGNYGYRDEMTGAGWRTKRTGMADEIPLRHWHLNDPGVVPNLLQLYAGSPTGILFYEGDLLPEAYHNAVIHSEAGANVIRAYQVEKDGYGYQAEILEIMKATDDPWFRPSDVCIAPDGSLFVADWYDPGVGGHLVGDQQRGRVFRVAPPGNNYTSPKFDFESIPGLIEALKSPNQATRFLGWTGLKERGDEAKDALMALFHEENPLFSARALWLLAEIDAVEAFKLGKISDNEDLQIVAIRVAKQKLSESLLSFIGPMIKSQSPQVRRELAVALRFQDDHPPSKMWATLATKYQGDRWFLEALGIGSDLHADARFRTWIDFNTHSGQDWRSEHNKDIVWRSRSALAVPLLAELILQSNDIESTHRYFRAFDFHEGTLKNKTIATIINQPGKHQDEFRKIGFRHLDPEYVSNSPELKKQLLTVVESYRGTEDFLLTIQKYHLQQYNRELLDLVLNVDPNRSQALRILLANEPSLVENVLAGTDAQQTSSIIASLGSIGNNQSLDYLETYMLTSKNPLSLRQQSAQYFASSWLGQNRMLELLENNRLPEELIQAAAGSMATAWRPGVRKEASKYLGIQPGTSEQMPGINELVLMEGDPSSGALVFDKFCQSCHVVNGNGVDFGPALSEIGSKLSREAMYVSILNPDAGISFGYEGYLVTLVDGSKITGLIQSRTASEITVKSIGGATAVYPTAQVTAIEQLENSLMTPNLHRAMDNQELIDLVSYLDELENPS